MMCVYVIKGCVMCCSCSGGGHGAVIEAAESIHTVQQTDVDRLDIGMKHLVTGAHAVVTETGAVK
jgi:hypothetical protein